LSARGYFILGLLAVPAAFGIWWWLGRGDGAPVVAASPGAAAQDSAGPDPRRGGDRRPTWAESAAAAPAPDRPAPAAGRPEAGADADRHPHPITPAHLRIQRENNLIGALNGAMDVADAVGLRGLLDQYRSEFPDDPNHLQQGYAVIADCLQYPGAASQAAGQSYYDRERGSILRRFVARHCQLP
jgi:hypothetical protein